MLYVFVIVLSSYIWCNDGMSKNKEKLLIIDGNALIHRSFHALPTTMKTKNGEVVNAVFGFASVLIKTIKDFKPEYVVLTLDKKGPTFRHEKFKEYKAKRVKAPDELYGQIPRVKELAKTFNIPIFEMSGFEADDLIGSIVELTDSKKQLTQIENIVVTGDMDLLQLINENTKVYKLGRGIADGALYNKELTKSKYGINPEQVIDYKALRGDASDNIPGVPGVGEKTALILLDEFKTLDNIYQYITHNTQPVTEKIKPRILNLLKDNKESAFLSRELAAIKCDVPIDFNLEDTRFGNFDMEAIIKLFSELEFNSLVPRIKELSANSRQLTANNDFLDKFERNKKEFKYYLINDDKDFNKFFNDLKEQKEFTFDTETTSVNPLACRLLGVSFSWKKGTAYYLNFDENKKDPKKKEAQMAGAGFNLFNYNVKTAVGVQYRQSWVNKLKTVFEDENVKKIAHNMKFDFRVMKNVGVKTAGVYFDTMIASYLFNPGSRQHGLDALTFNELGFEKISKDDLLGTGKDKISFGEVALEKLYLYSAEDADFTHRLYSLLKKKLREEGVEDLFKKIEMPLVEVLADMEENGIAINENFLGIMSNKLNSKIKRLEKRIHEMAGTDFNVRSTKQLKEVLFDKMQISTKGIKKNKTGISTAFDELEKLKDEHEIIGLIQEHRELAKLTSTYIDALPELVCKRTGRIHSSFNQTVTATGRLSSTDPNLQNIPIKTELGKEIRKAFVAPKSSKLLAIDYSQIELRVAAHLSLDKEMIKAFSIGADIHTQTAAFINKVKPEVVTPEMRRAAKAVNFGVLYGQGVHGLSKAVDINFLEAKNFIDDYFLAFSGLKKFIDKTIENAKKNGYVETMFERRRYLPDINSTTPMIKKAAERMAVNTPVQGTAADILKMAMIEIHKKIKGLSDIKMLLQVHDELVFEIKKGTEKKYAREIAEIMENIVKLKVPLVADAKVGDNWGEMEKI